MSKTMSELYLVALATEWVCPNTHIATTAYEKCMVLTLVKFGRSVLAASEKNDTCPYFQEAK